MEPGTPVSAYIARARQAELARSAGAIRNGPPAGLVATAAWTAVTLRAVAERLERWASRPAASPGSPACHEEKRI